MVHFTSNLQVSGRLAAPNHELSIASVSTYVVTSPSYSLHLYVSDAYTLGWLTYNIQYTTWLGSLTQINTVTILTDTCSCHLISLHTSDMLCMC